MTDDQAWERERGRRKVPFVIYGPTEHVEGATYAAKLLFPEDNMVVTVHGNDEVGWYICGQYLN